MHDRVVNFDHQPINPLIHSVVATPPVVSVVMPVYNGEKYLTNAITSILEQTFTDFEFIIINDGSTDSTAAILEKHSKDDPRIIVVTQEKRGTVDTLNRGCAIAHGRYIARMDCDDVSLPDRFAKQVAFLEQRPDVAVLSGAIEVISPNGRPLRTIHLPTTVDEVHRLLPSRTVLVHPAVMMRTDAFRKVRGYRNAFLHAEDYDLWLRMSESYKLANLPDVLIHYRFHPGQVCSSHGAQQAVSVLAARYCADARRHTAPEPDFPNSVANEETVLTWGISPKFLRREIAQRELYNAFYTILCGTDPEPSFKRCRMICSDDATWIDAEILVVKAKAFRACGKYARLSGFLIRLALGHPRYFVRCICGSLRRHYSL